MEKEKLVVFETRSGILDYRKHRFNWAEGDDLTAPNGERSTVLSICTKTDPNIQTIEALILKVKTMLPDTEERRLHL